MESKLQEISEKQEDHQMPEQTELKIVVPGDFIGEGYVAGTGTYVSEENN